MPFFVLTFPFSQCKVIFAKENCAIQGLLAILLLISAKANPQMGIVSSHEVLSAEGREYLWHSGLLCRSIKGSYIRPILPLSSAVSGNCSIHHFSGVLFLVEVTCSKVS